MLHRVPGLPARVHALVTTREQPGNLAVHVGDDPAQVLLHRRQLHRLMPNTRPIQWLQQVHGTQVVELSSAQVPFAIRQADACVSRTANVPCAVLTADCLPVLMYRQNGDMVAAAHAGWRGLLAGVLSQTVSALRADQTPQQRAENPIHAWIGPAISQMAFEVGNEVREAFLAKKPQFETFFRPSLHALGHKWFADLPAMAEEWLRELGVQQVRSSDWCTYHDLQWSSHRRDPNSGRIASVIWFS